MVLPHTLVDIRLTSNISWFDPQDGVPLEEEVRVLIDFIKEMQNESVYDKKIQRLSNLNFLYDDEEVPEEIFVIRDLPKTRKLILLLLGNEIDRIVAWNNPQNRLGLRLPDQDRYSTTKVNNLK